MKKLLLAAALVALVKSEGYYHQEAQYHSASSSYRDNELQHQNQDDGFYSEHGDLGRKTKPKINAYEQHSEYTNPKLKNDGSSRYTQGSGYGGSSYGSGHDRLDAYQAGHGSSFGQHSYGVSSNLQDLTRRLQSELARQLQGAVYKQYRESSGYSRSSSNSLSSSQMMQDLSELQDELRANLSRKFQEALDEQYGSQRQRGGYSYTLHGGDLSNTANYDNQELQDLKQQVEDNLLQQLQQNVRSQYQSSSRSSSFSSSSQGYGGNTGSSSNYYQPVVPLSTGSHTKTGYRSNDRLVGQTSSSLYPDLSSFNTDQHSSSSSYSLTQICHDVQTDLSQQINELLDEENSKNIELIKQGIKPNYDENFKYLKQQLQRNISRLLDDKIRTNYGGRRNYNSQDLESLKQQVEDNLVEKLSYGIRQQENRYEEQKSYYASYQTSSNRYGSSNQYKSTGYGSTGYHNNYNTDNQYGNYRPVPLSSGSHTSSSSSSGTYKYQNTQSSDNLNPNAEVELHNIKEQVQDDLTRQIQYAIRQQARSQSTYSSSSYQPDYQTLLRDLSDELQRNLTEKLQQQLQSQYGSQATKGAYSYTLSSGGSMRSSANYRTEQLEQLRNQLHENLMRQLQEGLRQSLGQYKSYGSSGSYGSSSSYSAASSYGASGSYGTAGSYGSSGGYGRSGQVKSLSNYGQLQADSQIMGEDCVQNDESSHAIRREITRGDMDDQDLRVKPLEFPEPIPSSELEDGQQQEDLTQQTEDLSPPYFHKTASEEANQYTQQIEDVFSYVHGHAASNEQEDLTQQTEDLSPPTNTNYGRFTAGVNEDSQKQEDLTQQTEDIPPQVSNDNQTNDDLTQHVQNSRDLTQQRTNGFGRLMTSSAYAYSHQHSEHHQSEEYHVQQRNVYNPKDDSEETTSPRSRSPLRLMVGNHNKNKNHTVGQNLYTEDQQQIDDLTQQTDDLTQQTEDLTQQAQDLSNNQGDYYTNYGRLRTGSQKKQDNLTQEIEDLTQDTDDLTQQSEDLTQQTQDLSNNQGVYYTNYGRLRTGSQKKQDNLTQEIDDLTQHTDDLTQQSEDLTQHTDDLTQQTEDLTQQDYDLTQQTEDLTHQSGHSISSNQGGYYTNYGKLQTGNQKKQEDLTQTDDLTQQKDDLTQQSDDLIQQNAPATPYNQGVYYTNYGRLRTGNQKKQEDLTQTDDLTQQKDDLTQQNDDLIQHNARVKPYNQGGYYTNYGRLRSGNQNKQDDLTQQTYDLTQQTDDLTQQTEDLSQTGSYGRLQTGTQSRQDSLRQHSNYQQSEEDLRQQTEDLYPSSRGNSYTNHGRLQTGSQRRQQSEEDLTQQTEDINPISQDYRQQSENLPQRSVNKNDDYQQSQDLTQQTEDLSPYSRSHQGSAYGRLQTGSLYSTQQHTRDDSQYQQREETPLSTGNYQLSQNSQNAHSASDEQNSDEERYSSPYGSSYQSSHRSSSAQASSSSHSAFESYSGSYNNKPTDSQLQYAGASDETSDLVQKPVGRKQAYELQEESQNIEDPTHEHYPGCAHDVETFTTTQRPGFWKRLGKKITNAYNKITG